MRRDYLIAFIGKEDYAFDIEHIQKIIEIKKPIKIAGSKEYISGVISYEGEALKIVDFNLLLDKKVSDSDHFKVLIYKSGSLKIGLKVDGVDRIAHIEEESIKSDNKNGDKKNLLVDFEGVIEFDKRLITIIKHIKIKELE